MGAEDWPFWDVLLEYIDDRRVIPIVGADLLISRHEQGDVSVYRYLAEKLSLVMGVPIAEPSEDALNSVIYNCMKQRNLKREDVYPSIYKIVRDMRLPIPTPLLELAGIRHFDLYITTTIDSMLKSAIEQERGNGTSAVKVVNYAPNSTQANRDIPAISGGHESPTVFHLFGQASPSPNYVLTEEDLLERLCDLLRDENRPQRLFDALKGHHLLLIGNRFPGWLALFFMRLAKGIRLSCQREYSEIVADPVVQADKNMVLFLQNISYRTRVFTAGSPIDFIAELSRRYHERHPGGEPPPPPPPKEELIERPPAVFISYSRKDIDSVQRIHDALDQAGIDVWFDKTRLRPGAKFSLEIKRNIERCELFLPIISANTEALEESYFRREWKMAHRRSEAMTDSKVFIIPVVIDQSRIKDLEVPESFSEANIQTLPDGEPTPKFVSEIKQLVREARQSKVAQA